MEIMEFMQMYEMASEATESIKNSGADSGALANQRLFEVMSPYMNPEMRRQLEIVTRLNRIKTMLESYSAAALGSKQEGGQWEVEALNAIRPYVDDRTERRIDLILSIYNLKNCLEALK